MDIAAEGLRRSKQGLFISVAFSVATLVAFALIAAFQESQGRHTNFRNDRSSHDGQGACYDPYIIPLWPHNGTKVQSPQTRFQPNQSCGASAVIAPGGAYWDTARDVEGTPYAKWLCAQGVASYVLQYGCASSGFHAPVPEDDARRALRVVRSQLPVSARDTHKIGVIGSSAGGHLMATLMAYNDEGNAHATNTIEQQRSRPDFGVLVYPVISMEDGLTHDPSKTNLFGHNLTSQKRQRFVEYFSLEKHVNHLFPPVFMFHTKDDAVVSVENTYRMVDALEKAKVEHKVMISEHGRHGQGLGDGSLVTYDGKLINNHPWTQKCMEYLIDLGMIGRTNKVRET